MSEILCAVCGKGKGPEKCEVCGFSDNGSINRQFPLAEDLEYWLETTVKPYRIQWEGQKREEALRKRIENFEKRIQELNEGSLKKDAQLSEAKKHEEELLAQIDTMRKKEAELLEKLEKSNKNRTEWIGHLANIIATVVDYAKSQKIDSNNTTAFLKSGTEYLLKKKDYDRAIEDFTKAINIDPNNASAYALRSFAYTQQGNMVKSYADYARAKKLGYK